MSRKEKLLQKAISNPNGLTFDEAVRLAGIIGLEIERTQGSHMIFGHDNLERPIPLQNVKGEAKPFQVRQLLEAARELGVISED